MSTAAGNPLARRRAQRLLLVFAAILLCVLAVVAVTVSASCEFRLKLDSDSGANWTLIPAESGQSFVVTQYAG